MRVSRSHGVDQFEAGRRLRLAGRLALGAMLVVVAIGCASPNGAVFSGTPLAVASPSLRVAAEIADLTPSLTPLETPRPTPMPTPKPTPKPTSEPTPIPMPTWNGQTTVYWIYAHPDDETISSAGAMYASQKAGNRNVLVFVTDGETTGVGPELKLSLTQIAAARDKEGTAALAVIGIVPVFLHEPDTGGGVQQSFVEQEIEQLASETKGPVVFEGLSPNDAYAGLPHGHPDHYAVARALQAEFNKGVIHNLVFRNLSNFSNGKRYGTCEFLSAGEMKTKQAMRAAYAYVNVPIGRYGIAGKSVGLMWRKTTTEPECHENVELHAGIALAP